MKVIKYFIIALVIILLTWVLPSSYELLLPTKYKTPLVLYSELDSSFIKIERTNDQSVITDFKGRCFTKRQCDSLLPFFYYRQLVEDGRMPDTLLGIPVTRKDIYKYYFYVKTSPRQLNRPNIGLYTLFESASGNVDLVLPPDLFRVTSSGLEFIECNSNQVLREKSGLFTEALKREGVKFPLRLIWGNASTRKEYDNGFLIADSENQVFHFKMVQDKPYVKPIESEGMIFKRLITLEPNNKDIIGIGVTTNNQLYVVTSFGTLQHVDIDEYDPDAMSISIMGNMFTWTITITTAEDTRYYAVSSREYKLVDRVIVPDPPLTTLEKVRKYVFPLRLTFISWRSQDVFPHYNEF